MSDKKNILVLTPLYPADDLPRENTPVVHYFTRQWVKMGYNVTVLHYPYNFPRLLLWVVKPFQKQIRNYYGMAVVRTTYLYEREYSIDGVNVVRIPLKKYLPHSRYSYRELQKASLKSIEYLSIHDFVPDVITGHWVNPQIDLLYRFKNHFHVPTCFVSHDYGGDLNGIYNKEARLYLNSLDVIGFRSEHIKQIFMKSFPVECPNFICYSGVPEEYVKNEGVGRTFLNIQKYLFVGNLIERKHPADIIPALRSIYENGEYELHYVGEGSEKKRIIDVAKICRSEHQIIIHGMMQRDKVSELMRQCDVFVMISEGETFGLVYLEAMAAGCITIASKREGFDGIIIDGVNGFLCEAGNSDDLANTIHKIRSLASDELSLISYNAIQTAKRMTDKQVANDYLTILTSTIRNN